MVPSSFPQERVLRQNLGQNWPGQSCRVDRRYLPLGVNGEMMECPGRKGTVSESLRLNHYPHNPQDGHLHETTCPVPGYFVPFLWEPGPSPCPQSPGPSHASAQPACPGVVHGSNSHPAEASGDGARGGKPEGGPSQGCPREAVLLLVPPEVLEESRPVPLLCSLGDLRCSKSPSLQSANVG